jgi:hypothetical protein
MPKPQRNENQRENEKRTLESLQDSVELLQKKNKSSKKGQTGISSDFSKKVHTLESAQLLCENAMAILSTKYVDNLLTLKHAQDPMEAMKALDQAEEIWEREAAVIQKFDADGGEVKFLLEMREQAYQLMADCLESSARTCSNDPSPVNIALCLAVIGVMDKMLGDFGRPETSSERQSLRDLAKSFK